MIFLYDKDTPGEGADAVKEIIRVFEKDLHMENPRCGALEECVPYLRRDSSVMDLRLVQKFIREEPDYCDETMLDLIYNLLDPVDAAFKPINSEIVYIVMIPESDLNSTDYLVESLVSNLNMLKGMELKPVPLAKSYTRNHPKLAYTFTLMTRNAMAAARLAKTHKIKGWE